MIVTSCIVYILSCLCLFNKSFMLLFLGTLDWLSSFWKYSNASVSSKQKYGDYSTNMCCQGLVRTCSDRYIIFPFAALGAELLYQGISGAVRAASAGRGWHRHPPWCHQEGGTRRLILQFLLPFGRILIWCVELQHVLRGRMTLTWLNPPLVPFCGANYIHSCLSCYYHQEQQPTVFLWEFQLMLDRSKQGPCPPFDLYCCS